MANQGGKHGLGSGAVIGITGCSRSGKSWVAKALAERLALPGERVVGQDVHWRHAVPVSLADGRSVNSEEEPECTDHPAFARAIEVAAIGGGGAAAAGTGGQSVVIAEGFQLVHDATVTSLLTGPIFYLEMSREECIRRRTAPPGGAAPNANPLSLADCEQLVWPAHERYLERSVLPLGARVVRLQAPSTPGEVAALVDLIVGHQAAAQGAQCDAARLLDVTAGADANLSPIFGLQATPLESLARAIEAACAAPALEGVELGASVALAQRFARRKLQHGADPHGLPLEEIAVVHFYTQQTPFYPAINAALRSEDRATLKPFFKFLKLAFTAMHKLPPVCGCVFRGVKLPLAQVGQYEAGAPVLWWGFSSTTARADVLSNPSFLGDGGDRTMFQIQISNGVNIKAYSSFHVEDEVLLLPGTNMVVESVLPLGNGLNMVQMREDPILGLIDMVRPSPFAAPPPLAPAATAERVVERVVVHPGGVGSTLLRKVATKERSAAVWAGGCVVDGDSVTVGRAEGEFSWVVATNSGEEGFVRTNYLHARVLQVQRPDDVGSTLLRKKAADAHEWAGGEVADGVVVVVMRRETGFSWVATTAGDEGYIRNAYLHVPAAETTRPDDIGSTLLRKKASGDHEWAGGCVADGERVTVIMHTGEYAWVVLSSGEQGFMRLAYLKV